MTAQNSKRNWLNIVYQSLGIAALIIGVLAVPIEMRFDFVEARNEETREIITKHIDEHKDLETRIPNRQVLEQQYETIVNKLEEFAIALRKCQEADEEWREKFYEYISKNK